MSEEQNIRPHGKCIWLIVLTVLSLLMSSAALTLSILAFNGGVSSGSSKKIVISKKYDRGKSIEKALETKKPMIVFFYTDWCGFCQRFAPTFDKITKSSQIKKNFAVAYVNCENPQNAKTVEEYGIEGFPTVFVVDENGKRTHLDNSIFFIEDAKEKVSAKALEIIKK